MSFSKKTVPFVCLVLMLGLGSLFGQEFSLDDNPTPPPGPWGPGAPPMPPFESAEDEFGILGGGLGPSPSLLMGFVDADILAPGPGMAFPSAPPLFYVDAFSLDHMPVVPPPPPGAVFPIPGLMLHFSVDRFSVGTPGTAVAAQSAVNDQPADIYDSDPTWFPPFNFLRFDQWIAFGLWPPNPPPVTPWARGSHDNIDGYNEMPGPAAGMNIYYCLHQANAVMLGFSPGDIFFSPAGLPALTFLPPPFAIAPQMGITPADSIDALVVWDNAGIGVCDPGIDIALFSLAPGSPTLAMGGWDGATIFWTDFTAPPIPVVYCWGNQLGLMPGDNVDALEAF